MTSYHSSVSTLHVTNGDCAGDTLRRFADGPVITVADVLHEGPAPAVDDDAWYATRGAFLGDDAAAAERIAAGLAASDRTIRDALARGDAMVLWFEHDLFDQLLLIRLLDLIGRAPAAAGAVVSLICIDRFPGVERFIGLGQLDAAQLQSLYPARQPLRADQLAVGAAAWEAFRSPDPRRLREIAIGNATLPLPFLRDALLRFLAEYPSAANGLTLTEHRALAALADGPLSGGALFTKTQADEPRPFIGDSTFFDTLRALASARTPLVDVEAPADRIDLRHDRIALTAAGHDVVAARRDRVALNGISMWRGGVHLAGRDRSPYRWDARSETLVS
jgi:hypothetical protein